MKVTGLLLFIILLIVLVVSVILGKNMGFRGTEGFITYRQPDKSSTGTNPTLVKVPTYSMDPVAKLFDNLYFDMKNGNLVEVDSPKYTSGGATDMIGNTVTKTIVTTRANSGTSFEYSGNVSILPGGGTTVNNVSQSQICSVSTSYSSYVYTTKSKNTDTYCVLYIPWYTNTYIHILDITNSTHVGTYGMSQGLFNILNYPTDPNTGVPKNSIGLTVTSTDNDSKDNSFVTDDFYDVKKVLYQVSKYVKYDITNGSLIVQTQNTPKSVTIYNRVSPITSAVITSPNTISNTPSKIQSLTFSPALIQDPLGKNVILYIPDGTNTLVAVITMTNSGTAYTLRNVVRFTPNTVDTGSDNASGIMSMVNTFMSSNTPSYTPPSLQQRPGGSTNYSDDYILKTQIVPPVCPSCPSCAQGRGSVCTNCGGQGGSGTQSASGGTMVTGESDEANPHTFFGKGSPTTGKKDAAGNDIPWKSDVGKGTFSSNADPNTLAGGLVLSQYSMVAGLEEGAYTAADVVKTGIGAAGGAVKDVAGGIGSAASGLGTGLKDTAAGAVDLAKSAGAGTVDLAKSAGSGLMQMSREQKALDGGVQGQAQGMAQGQTQAQAQGQAPVKGTAGYSGITAGGPQTMDQYSYYGSLPPKVPTNFMPVTADFSSFKK